jgi:hypothetical protein
MDLNESDAKSSGAGTSFVMVLLNLSATAHSFERTLGP